MPAVAPQRELHEDPLRRVHKDEWQAHTSRLRVWCTNNLAPIKGACQWCGHKAQQGRDHRATCPAIFQLAMTWFMTGGPPDLPAMMGPTDAPFPSAEGGKTFARALSSRHFEAAV